MTLRDAAKAGANAVAALIVLPSVASFAARAKMMGRDRALEGSTQLWALAPGLVGQYLRRAFLRRTIAHCSISATVEFGTIFSSANCRIGAGAYVGPRCHLGWVEIEPGALLSPGVHVPSGRHTHGSDDPTQPIRDQPGDRTCVRIGEGAWIGSAAVIMADVGAHSIVGAGAVVTKPVPTYTVAAGVPAHVIRPRTVAGQATR